MPVGKETQSEKERKMGKFPECIAKRNYPDCPKSLESMNSNQIHGCVLCPCGGEACKKLYDCLI